MPQDYMKSSRARLSVLIIASTFLCVLSVAQSSPSNSVVRDSTTIQLLNRVLQQSGGNTAWQAIHALRVTGSMSFLDHSSTGSNQVTRQLDWLDDWSKKNPRYVRSVTTPKGIHTVRHDASETSTTTIKGKQIKIRSFDSSTVLLTHSPAAALSIILKSEDYSVQLNKYASSAKDTVIDVSKANGACTQQWFISKTSGQVHAVRFAVVDAIQGQHQPWEVVVYKHYYATGALTVPDEAVLTRPDGESITFHFKTLEANPAVTDDDFRKGATQ